MIALFTDFGSSGPYVGQMQAVLAQEAAGVPVIPLFHDAPTFAPQLSAYLLPAYAAGFPKGTVFLCVVDPGVGGVRAPAVLQADGRYFVGPENGLFALMARRATEATWWEITWRAPHTSATFHGRDLFAPVAARLARETPDLTGLKPRPLAALERPDWPDDLPRICYIDHFGNAMTGLRAATLADDATLAAGGRSLRRARTFGDLPEGDAFWYENANGLAEIAVNRGRADVALGLAVGDPVTLGP